jgi:hypothetical protein
MSGTIRAQRGNGKGGVSRGYRVGEGGKDKILGPTMIQINELGMIQMDGWALDSVTPQSAADINR